MQHLVAKLRHNFQPRTLSSVRVLAQADLATAIEERPLVLVAYGAVESEDDVAVQQVLPLLCWAMPARPQTSLYDHAATAKVTELRLHLKVWLQKQRQWSVVAQALAGTLAYLELCQLAVLLAQVQASDEQPEKQYSAGPLLPVGHLPSQPLQLQPPTMISTHPRLHLQAFSG
jgi:hypothetical protein